MEPRDPEAQSTFSQPQKTPEQDRNALDRVRKDSDAVTIEDAVAPARPVDDHHIDHAPESDRKIQVHYGSGVQIGDISGQVNFYADVQDPSVAQVRKIFIDSIRKRDDFMSTFLNQAMRQSNIAFNLSICFMVVGGLVVLAAAALAVSRFAGSPSHGIALVSGIGGVLISTSGAAFSRRSDKSRKHLAQQAAMMQSQLLDEQRFSQVVDLLTGIRDPNLNDQARISLAMRLMGDIDSNKKDHE